MSRRVRATVTALTFLAPNLLGFLAFTAWPILASMLFSLTNWNLQDPHSTAYVGFRNYGTIFADRQFWLYFVNTAYFLLGLPVSIAGSLFVAVMLNQRLRGHIVFRTLLYLPSFTSGVAIMILWKALYNPEFGPINTSIVSVGHALGLHLEAPQWLLSTKNVFGLTPENIGLSGGQFGLGARDALIYMGIWTAIGGGNMLLYLAALSNVPSELVEAAQLDGASRWQSFRNVTWPQLAPTTFFIVVMSIIGGLQGGFEQARVMTGGGPAGTTTTLAYYIYSKAFEEFQLGYASAVSWLLFGIIFVWTILQWKFGNKETSIL